MTVVSVSHLYFRYASSFSLRFGQRRPVPWLLQDVNLEVFAGEIVAVTGANGAGKSTLLRLLALLLLPTQGRVAYWGREGGALPRSHRRQIAWLGNSERSFSWRLTGRQNLYFFATLRGMDSSAYTRELARLAPALGLERLLDQRVDRYSHGQKQRLAWARLLLPRPTLLLLDEPFLGLDDDGRQQVWQLLQNWWPSSTPPTLIIATPSPDATFPWTQTLTLPARTDSSW
jgi:ABC-type multidrug transport system ATPase subunit